MNTFGRLLRLTTWGESHGRAIGAVVDGFPAGFELDLNYIQEALNRRRPGQGLHTSPRREGDTVEFLSGIFEGKTTGTPIAFVIENQDQRSGDYDKLRDTYRPGHADRAYQDKYGIRDHRGGGRASARETALRVVAGAMAEQYLISKGISIYAYADQIGAVKHESEEPYPYTEEELINGRATTLGFDDEALQERMLAIIEDARREGDSIGGIVACQAFGIPVGLGEPIYDKLEARLSSAMMSINATRGFEIGDGFGVSTLKGSEYNDEMHSDPTGGGVRYGSNHAGGTLGGISTGQVLCMRVAFRPTASIGKAQHTVTDKGDTLLQIEGRHDPCVVPRAIPVVRAMCALVLMDMVLLHKTSRMTPQ